ncbi:MAG: ABC transporter ATP-binding protein [Anaerolineales bacterium]
MTALIEARHLRRAFGDKLAVDDLSLQVEAGEIYALVGPDGAGKTTTMRLLCGALTADHGTVTLAGFDLERQTEQARAQIGYLPQRFSLYGELTVQENLRFFAEVRGMPGDQWMARAQEILAFVGLEEFRHRRAEALSGGMRQKLGLAAAMVHRPQVLLLDEPTGGVDPVTRQSFWQLLIQLLRQGACVLISTPYMDEAARSSRVGFLYQGRLLVEGSPGEVVQRFQGHVLELLGGPRRLLERLARDDPEVQDTQALGDRILLRVSPGNGEQVMRRIQTAAAARGGEIASFREVAPRLEDAFLAILEQAA